MITSVEGIPMLAVIRTLEVYGSSWTHARRGDCREVRYMVCAYERRSRRCPRSAMFVVRHSGSSCLRRAAWARVWTAHASKVRCSCYDLSVPTRFPSLSLMLFILYTSSTYVFLIVCVVLDTYDFLLLPRCFLVVSDACVAHTDYACISHVN